MELVRKDGRTENVIPFPWDSPIKDCNPRGKFLACREKFGRREHWYEYPLFIDTETSHVGENTAWVHQWAVCWGGLFFIGRTARQLVDFLCHVSSWAARKGKDYRVLGYIHNMGYDMEYLRQFFPDEEPEFFAVKPHRILTAKYKHIEIRCSYLLTQKSLDKWGKDSARHYKKLVGTYDYKRVITPGQPLTDLDWSYQLGDVAVMRDAWEHDREIDGYDARTVPLTSTGFVRNDCRTASEKDVHWRGKLDAMQPDIEIYNGLEKAFQGGYTHGNRFFQEQTVKGPIGHRDFCSSYPARQIINAFPMGAFREIELTTPGEIAYLSQTTALLMHIALRNPHLKTRSITAPYLGISKCSRIGETKELLDNGRVVQLTGIVDTWVTEYDFLILQRQYDFDFQIIKAYAAPKGKLPLWLRNTVMDYFRNKTTLKHSDYMNYMRSKAKLNGIFGMTAQKYIRDDLIYENGEWIEKPKPDADRETELEKVKRKKTTFLPFAWGVWTTALARYALFYMIEAGCGYERFLYADTDSIFYRMDTETEETYSRLNSEVCAQAVNAGGYCDHNGQRSTLGEFSPEDDMPLQAFTFVHAKCYAVIDKQGQMQVTVAGVTKRQRSDPEKTNADELGSLDNLRQGFIFKECGGTRIVYNNEPLHTIEYNGESIEVGASAVIMDTEYKVSNLNEIDMDDETMLHIIQGQYIGDIYGDFGGMK